MKRWATLNNRQLVVLQRIGEAGDHVTSAEPTLARTVYALRDRDLVDVVITGKKAWTTQLTDAGRFYLEHGHHPDRPSRRASSRGRSSGTATAPSELAVPAKPPIVWDGRSRMHVGCLWKPVAGATATFEEWIDARAQVLEINRDRTWNSWRSEGEREAGWLAARAVFAQWDRAEPDFRRMTQAEIDAMLEEVSAKFNADHDEKVRQREARIPLYDAKRHGQLQSLLEQETYLRYAVGERDGLVDGSLFPLMASERRVVAIEEATAEAARLQAVVDQVREEVGDPEGVGDELGWLPQDRREFSLSQFSWWRRQEICRLRAVVAALEAKLAEGADRAARREIRDELSRENERREFLERIAPLKPADMCSECVSPKSWHGRRMPSLPGMGSCPAWPEWAANREAFWKELRERQKHRAQEEAAAKPKPKPVAVIPSKLPIEEVLSRLAELQTQHPGAIVRRGNANRWELWPPGTKLY